MRLSMRELDRAGVIRQVVEGRLTRQAFAQGRLEVIDTVLHNIGNAANSVATGVGTLRERLRSRKLRSRLAAVAVALDAHGDDWLEYLRDDPQGTQVVPFLLALDRDWTQENAELLAITERATERVDRIAEILRTQQSLDIGSTERKTVRVERTIRAGVRILEESLTAQGIAARVDCSGAPAEVALQESRFHQMLVHIVRNGIEAIAARRATGGPGFDAAVEIVTRIEAEQWFVDVTDNGIGIAPEYLDRLFTPGFTTKDEGSGLGLHCAANYVIGSGGRIEALSDGRNQGATIRSSWPLRAVLPG